MAANSKRERIILNVVSTLEDISTLTTIQRTRPAFNDMGNLDLVAANLPLAAVIGKAPVPEGNISSQDNAEYIYFTSELPIEISVYAAATSSPDSVVSTLMDDIWVELHKDLTRGSYALMTSVEMEVDEGLNHPYVIFRMNITVTYTHGIDSI